MKGFSFLRRRRWRCSWWPAAARGRRTRRNIGAPRPGTLVQWANCQPAHPDACPPAPNAGCSRSRWTTPSPMASSPMDLWWRTHWRVSFSRIFPVARAGDAFHPSPRVLGDRRQAIPCEGGGPSNAGDVQDLQLSCACRQSGPGLVKWPGGAHPVDRGRRLWDMRCAMWLDITVNPGDISLNVALTGAQSS